MSAAIFIFAVLMNGLVIELLKSIADKTQVNKYSTPQQKIELFKSLFCGRADVYAKRYYNTKTGKSGYVPACSNEWVNFVCDKKKYTCSKCPNHSFIEMNDRVIYNHLKGRE